MNKIIFCSEPDTVSGQSFALKNLIEDTSSIEWKEQIENYITKTFDCSIDSLAYIVEHAR